MHIQHPKEKVENLMSMRVLERFQSDLIKNACNYKYMLENKL